MSIPVSVCLISKAAHGDEKATVELFKVMKVNIECGHYTTFPCRCAPPCPVPTSEMMARLNKRMLDVSRKEEWKYTGRSGEEGPPGKEE